MSEPYTPTTETVYFAYLENKFAAKGIPYDDREDRVTRAEFDRWFIREIEAAEYSGYLRAVQDVDNTRHRFGTGDA